MNKTLFNILLFFIIFTPLKLFFNIPEWVFWIGYTIGLFTDTVYNWMFNKGE